MTDQAVDWLHGVRGHDRRSPGSCTTRPAAATRPITSQGVVGKYKGRFDQGWDRLREEHSSARSSSAWSRPTPS